MNSLKNVGILEHLSFWAKEYNKIVVAVLHDLNLVNLFAKKVILLSEGKIVGKGPVKDVFLKDTLEKVYDIDVKDFMINSLLQWQ
jgi:iron complex transport system ATP-binding protein